MATNLYHYTSLDTLERILDNGIRISRWSTLQDDLFEKYLFNPISNDENSLMVDSKIKENLRVLCLCGDLHYTQENGLSTSLPGYMHSRMWEKYGKGYKGVCLSFHADILLNEFTSAFPVSRYGKVRYVAPTSEKLNVDGSKIIAHAKITVSNINGPIQEEKLTAKGLLEDADSAVPLFLTKFIDYRDESETRLLAYDERQEECYLPIGNFLSAAYFGEMALPSNELIEKLKVNCFRLSIRREKTIWGNSLGNYKNPPKYFLAPMQLQGKRYGI